MLAASHAKKMRSKGHVVMRKGQLHIASEVCAAAAGMGLHVDRTAHVSSYLLLCVADAYDREFRGMYEELPPRDKARMRVADRVPNAQTVACRKLFGNLEF